MPSVGIHPPKTPVTKGSHTISKATIPNICKMPSPPAPFIPAPLPNIAKSELSPQGYSTTVTIEGNAVAIRGATFESMGDMASKGTGGGLLSSNTHGPAKFISPGSMTVKIEGKSVHLLGEPMLNNCGPGGNPPNTGATMMGADHSSIEKPKVCPPHGPEVPKDGNHAEEVAEAERRVAESEANLEAAKTAQANADAAVANPPKGARMSTLRQDASRAAKAVPGAEHHLKMQKQKLEASQWEKKVADDEGGKNVKLVCKQCGAAMGDLDVVAKGKVKEVKSSEGGFTERRDQFDRYKALVEGAQIVGPGMVMKVAVPTAEVAKVETAHPDLAGKVQGH